MSSSVMSVGSIDQLLSEASQRVSTADVAAAQASVRRIQEDTTREEQLIYKMFAAAPRV
jgi:hypothetical protein